MNDQVSLVLASYGRIDDVGRLLESLLRQTDPAFEVLVVDQNPDDRLVPMVHWGTAQGLRLRHFRMSEPNLSKARNLGIAEAGGSIVGFPDDDCWYEPDVVAQVRSAFAQSETLMGLSGCWVETDRLAGQPPASGTMGAQQWLDFQIRGGSSITLFLRRTLLQTLRGFDGRFGVGQWYGAGEETDLLLRALRHGARIDHWPLVAVHHPAPLAGQASLAARCRAVRSRGRGTGALYAKHRVRFTSFLRGLLGQVLKPLARCRLTRMSVGISAACGMVEGYIRWRNDERGSAR